MLPEEEECLVVEQAFLRKFICKFLRKLGNHLIENPDCSCTVIIFFWIFLDEDQEKRVKGKVHLLIVVEIAGLHLQDLKQVVHQ